MIHSFQIAMEVIVIVFVVTFFYRMIRIQYALLKVSKKTEEEKESIINKAIESAGFIFDEKNDCFYAAKNSWQRETGYCKLYDEGAISFGMIIDCEPIYFTYDDKQYLIEFWKGQYGMAVGAEIGVYIAEEKPINIPGIFKGPFFQSVPDSENLYMYFSLLKDHKEICRRNDKHWWLTVFKLGDFCNPEQLIMDIEIMFPNQSMSYAFYEGLRMAGYARNEIKFFQNVVTFTFDKPKTKQPSRGYLIGNIVQRRNRRNCSKYNKVTKRFTRTVDKITYIRYRLPRLYKLLIHMGKTKKMFDKFKDINKFRNQ